MPKPYTKTVWNKEPKAKVKKPKKPKTVSLLAKNKERSKDKPYRVKQADKWFSVFIRLFRANKDGYVVCYTCGKSIHRKDAHCCHWEERGNYFTRWEVRNCRPGCSGCNTYNQERHKRIMTIKLIREYGLEMVEQIHATKYDLARLNVIEIKEKALYWKEKAQDLTEKLGIEVK